jgi:hypothetical protein
MRDHDVWRGSGDFRYAFIFRLPASLKTADPHLLKSGSPSLLSSNIKFEFHGASEYLEDLVSRIIPPALRHLSISFFSQLIIDVPRLCLFIGLVDALSSPTEVTVELCPGCALVFLNWRLSFVAQIFSQLSPLLSNVRSFAIRRSLTMISKERDSPDEGRDVDPTQWLELFQPFNAVRSVRIDEEFVPDVVQVLGMVTDDVLFPALTSLELPGYRKSASVQDAAQLIIEARQRSGRKINLYG